MPGASIRPGIVEHAQPDGLVVEPGDPPLVWPGIASIAEPQDPLVEGMRHEAEVLGEGNLVDAMQQSPIIL